MKIKSLPFGTLVFYNQALWIWRWDLEILAGILNNIWPVTFFSGAMTCQVTSSTHGAKTRTNVTVKHGKYYLKHNTMDKVSLFFYMRRRVNPPPPTARLMYCVTSHLGHTVQRKLLHDPGHAFFAKPRNATNFD